MWSSPQRTQSGKEDLEGLGSAGVVLHEQGLPIGKLDNKIQKLEARTKQGKLALPAIEAKLTAAQTKVTKCVTRYKQILEQLKKAKGEGTKAVQLLEELEG